MPKFNEFLFGSPEIRENVSTLRKEQEPLYRQLTQAGMQKGAGGAFGNAADYYRGLLSDNSQDMEAFAAPEMRRYREQIVPDLAEQFAGMGSGGLSSSGFMNAQMGAGTDLSERLGAIRANLRQSGAQGLQSIGQQGLQPYSQNMVTTQGTQGFLADASPAIGAALPAIGAGLGSFFGPAGTAIGSAAGNWFSSKFGPQQQSPDASPKV
jgi:hypothetical protein